MELYLIFAALYFPFFVWLSLTYIKHHKDGMDDSNRKVKYVGFLLTLSIFHFLSNNLFELNATYGLFTTTLIILLFSMYMLRDVVRDKKSLIVIEEK
jgi:hypothetical protein